MLPNRRIASFSLVELLVVLVLSSIIVGIIYFTYYTIWAYHKDLSLKLKKLEDSSSIYFMLKRDFEESREIKMLTAHEIECTLPHSLKITYSFSPAYVMRKQLDRVDTFYCPLEKPVFSFEGQLVADNKPIYIDEISIEMDSLTSAGNVHIFKQYDAGSLIRIHLKDTMP